MNEMTILSKSSFCLIHNYINAYKFGQETTAKTKTIVFITVSTLVRYNKLYLNIAHYHICKDLIIITNYFIVIQRNGKHFLIPSLKIWWFGWVRRCIKIFKQNFIIFIVLKYNLTSKSLWCRIICYI